MVNVKMTLEDRDKYLSIIDDEIDSKLSDLSEKKNIQEEHPESNVLNVSKNQNKSVKKELPNMNLAERDNYLSKIEKEIKSKKDLLLEKRKYLKKISEDNRFLTSVNTDYQKYYDFIIKQKEDQVNTLSYLNDYIQDIMTNTKLTDQDIVETNQEQKRVLKEIKNIRKSLEEILQT
jgi:hypothetical protein